jgi:ribosomal protein L32
MQRHVDSSPSSLIEAVKSLSKGAEIIAHSLVLISKRNAELEAANKAATRRKSHKRKRVQKEGTLTVAKRVRLTTLKEFNARSNRKKAKKRARVEVGEPSQRRCRRCGEAGHNSRTCKQEAEIVSK